MQASFASLRRCHRSVTEDARRTCTICVHGALEAHYTLRAYWQDPMFRNAERGLRMTNRAKQYSLEEEGDWRVTYRLHTHAQNVSHGHAHAALSYANMHDLYNHAWCILEKRTYYSSIRRFTMCVEHDRGRVERE